jgi:hypothetical protein
MGQAAIAAKFARLSFGAVIHSLTKIDAQPTPNNGVMVLITGQLKVRVSCEAFFFFCSSPFFFFFSVFSSSSSHLHCHHHHPQTDDNHPHSFTQAFHLVHNPADNGYYIFNDFFRLLLHNM